MISSVKIRSIGRRHLRSQDQDRGCRHYLQSRLDSLVVGTYIAKIKIVVTKISTIKIKFIGHRHLRNQDQDHGSDISLVRSIGGKHLRSQDQDRGRSHFFSQDQIH